MEINKKVSIIVPCYNHAHYLNDCLQSVLNQTYENWECIIVNDGSPDNTEEIANQWVNKDIRFIHVLKKNGGLSSARNFGINHSQGDFILPLDADDYIDSTFVEKTLTLLQAKEQIGAVSSYVQCFGITNYLWQPKGGSLIDFLIENNTCATALFKKSIWIQAGGYDETMTSGFEDWEFWIRVASLGYTVQIINEPLFYYRKTGNSMLNDSMTKIQDLLTILIEKNKQLYINNINDIVIRRELQVLNLKNEMAEINFELSGIKSSKYFKLILFVKKIRTVLFKILRMNK